MTIQDIYNLAIKLGITSDPRGKSGVEKSLMRVKKEFQELPKGKQADFDLESLTNPYADSRILFGDQKIKVKKILVGVDIGVGEVLLADRLGNFDLILGHHPHGGALSSLHEVMELQIDLLSTYGVPVNAAYH